MVWFFRFEGGLDIRLLLEASASDSSLQGSLLLLLVGMQCWLALVWRRSLDALPLPLVERCLV